MPLPNKVVDRLSWESPQTPGWSSKLLMLSSTIFFLSALVYVGLRWGYLPYLNGQITRLNGQIDAFSKQVPEDQQKNIASFYSQLVNMRTLLNNHIISSSVFDWLERNTQKNVYYARFAMNSGNKQITLTGAAPAFDDVTQQLQIFKEQPVVKQMTISSVSQAVSQNGWQFSVTLTLDPTFFQPGLAGSTQ